MTPVQNALLESFRRVFTELLFFLPGFVALVVAIVVFALVGMAFAWVVRQILTRIRFDERLSRQNSAGVSDWAPSHSPTLLVSRIVLWACLLLGLVVGVSTWDAAYNTTGIMPFFLPYLAHSVGAIIILIIGTILARYLSRSVLISGVNANLQYARALSLGVKWLVYVFTGAMVLDHLGIGGMIVALGFGILFGGIVLALALSVGLGSRDIVARSIERTAERNNPDLAPDGTVTTVTPISESPRSLRHF